MMRQFTVLVRRSQDGSFSIAAHDKEEALEQAIGKLKDVEEDIDWITEPAELISVEEEDD